MVGQIDRAASFSQTRLCGRGNHAICRPATSGAPRITRRGDGSSRFARVRPAGIVDALDWLTMLPAGVELDWVGDRHLRVRVGMDSSERTHERVLAAVTRLRQASIPGLIDLTPAYATVLLSFDAAANALADVPRLVREAVRDLDGVVAPRPSRVVEIPVCYEPAFALDIQDVARMNGLTVSEVASLHAGAVYTVRFLGFSPGFPYLSGLPARLATPRLDRPRIRVPAGSVSIAGEQAGVYPKSTPGGWRIIGRTPEVIFDAARPVPSSLQAGDRVTFVPIDAAQFASLAMKGAT